MLLRLLLCAVAFSVSPAVAADPDHFGRNFPQPAGNDTAGSEAPEGRSVTLGDLPGKAISAALQRAENAPEAPAMRGRKEIEVYRNAAPAVVLVITKDGFGSGVHIGGGKIVTNAHVVEGTQIAGVFFKPQVEGAKLSRNAIVRGDVIKVDRQRDLALLQASSVPPAAKTLDLGSEAEVQIGADVHAIGHPTGEVWTYTRGLISQVRLNYAWKTEEGSHRANVIQTQTPINPGNSGGPLIGDSGKLLGLNSFKGEGEGMNFAVSVKDVAKFIAGPAGSLPLAGKPGCKGVVVYSGRDKANTGVLKRLDMDCDGKVDSTFWYPDDPNKPYQLLLDMNGDGAVDVVIEDTNRDGKWDISYYDTDFDGVPDLIGYHYDGSVRASRFERYASR